MIQLHHDYLLLETSNGETIPCSAELVAVELVGKSAPAQDLEVVKQAAAAVLYYFKHDLGRDSVSIGDFSVALSRVLTSFGVKISEDDSADAGPEEVSDLRQLACDSGKGFELAFFPHLREELRKKLSGSPPVLKFQGLRGCVKQLLGAKRWNHRCQELNDQIVVYLRECLSSEEPSISCGLVVK
jgi:hypothetical protein